MRPIRVLIVDDSAFVRKVLREILAAQDGVEVVGIARDGLEALEKIASTAPDVVTLDLMMPHLDGLGVLAALPRAGAPRVVVVSSAGDDSQAVVSALLAGATTAVHKPTATATERLYEVAQDLVRAVREAAAARPAPIAAVAPVVAAAARPRGRQVVVLGASTGGPHALTRVLTALPATFPAPLAAVVHLPVGFTEPFAERLDSLCALRVEEASDGAPLVPGRVLIGKAGLHLRLDRERARLDPSPLESLHRPSVDALFSSAAEAYGSRVLAVVLTGMGDDGLAGARAVVAAGGAVLTQSAATCVVYGMPRAVEAAGLSSASVDLEDLAAAIVERA